jgi:lysophospholipase L1-like esterase
MSAYRDEAADPDCLAAADAARLFATVPWTRMAVLGDSITAGVREPTPGYRDLSSDQRVFEALRIRRPDLERVNLARRDLTVAEITEAQLPAALDFRPDLVIVAAGGNDALRRSFNERAFTKNLAGLLAPLRETGAMVAVLGLFDLARSGLVPEPRAAAMAGRFDLLDSLTAQLTRELDCVLVDLHRHRRTSDAGIFSSDLLHCNARGHAVAAAACLRVLAATLVS